MSVPPPLPAPAAPPADSAGAAPAGAWADTVAGLCVAGLLIPESIAYAGLAHVPVGHALSATLVGLALYALLGGSRVAVVAPTSSTAVLSAAAVASVPALAGLPPGQALAALVLAAGAVLLGLGLARQGQLSAFISRPVLRGFAFALAVSIVIKQLPDVLGLTMPAGTPGDPLHILLQTVRQPSAWHGPTLAVAAAAALALALLRRLRRLPAALLVIVAAIAASQGLDLRAHGVAEVGAIAAPAFALAWPQLPLQAWLRTGELAVGLVVLVFAESWASMRSAALARGDSLDADRELRVLGLCNLGSALLQGMAVGAGFSATSANVAAGAQSRRAGATALVVIALALWLALPALHRLPRPVLAVAVIGALAHALSVQPLRAVWRLRRDRLPLLAAVVAVLLLGVMDGMLAAIAISVGMALRRFSQPVVHELGEIGDTRNFVVLHRHAQAHAVDGVRVLWPEEPLFFASAERVVNDVVQRAAAAAPGGSTSPAAAIVLSLEESADLDSTAFDCLRELDARLARQGQRLLLARVKDSVRELLARADPQGLGREERLFWSVADAVAAAQARAAAQPR